MDLFTELPWQPPMLEGAIYSGRKEYGVVCLAVVIAIVRWTSCYFVLVAPIDRIDAFSGFFLHNPIWLPSNHRGLCFIYPRRRHWRTTPGEPLVSGAPQFSWCWSCFYCNRFRSRGCTPEYVFHMVLSGVLLVIATSGPALPIQGNLCSLTTSYLFSSHYS